MKQKVVYYRLYSFLFHNFPIFIILETKSLLMIKKNTKNLDLQRKDYSKLYTKQSFSKFNTPFDVCYKTVCIITKSLGNFANCVKKMYLFL